MTQDNFRPASSCRQRARDTRRSTSGNKDVALQFVRRCHLNPSNCRPRSGFAQSVQQTMHRPCIKVNQDQTLARLAEFTKFARDLNAICGMLTPPGLATLRLVNHHMPTVACENRTSPTNCNLPTEPGTICMVHSNSIKKVCPIRWIAGFCMLVCITQDAAASSGQSVTIENRTASDQIIAADEFDYPLGLLQDSDSAIGWKQSWKISGIAGAEIIDVASAHSSKTAAEGSEATIGRSVQLRGTGNRNNPIRRQLQSPLAADEIFFRFDLNYQHENTAAETLDKESIDPEFFVLWLDRLDGGDQATHAANVPNIGVHAADKGPQKGRNVFMVRIGPEHTAWSNIELEYNRTFHLAAKLSKTETGIGAEYDRLDLWIDPRKSLRAAPDASLSGVRSLSLIQWVGFSTGQKTESTDTIQVRNLRLTTSWDSLFDDVFDATPTDNGAREHNGAVWDQLVDFKRDVYPLLKSRCFDCHAGDKPESGYRLDVHRELQGYSSGEVLAEPGRSRHSRIIEVVSTTGEKRMPPNDEQPLSNQQIAMLKAWIDQGMQWDDELLPSPRPKSDHWAFQPIKSPKVPVFEKDNWSRTPVDAFIRQAHLDAGLTHAAEASRLTLLRRVYLDVIGLPPTPEQAQEFINNDTDHAYEELVETLLQSVHYGERWGRYWLDLARWAESQGYQHDFVRPYAWRYRDYVVASFNADKPYDRFLKEQLAGDELQPYSDENLIATGFLAAARISGNQEDDNIQRNDVMVDIVNATGSAILGLTLECAQCHNHKFDPISQRDYYRLQAFFVKGQLGNLSLRDHQTDNPTNLAEWIPKPAYDFYSKEVAALAKKKLYSPTDLPHTWGYLSAETGDPGIKRFSVVNRRPIKWEPDLLKQTEARMLIRGDIANPGPVVESGWPEVMGITPDELGEKPRLALAEWLADPKNPLVSRVWVNRIWQYHFGRGIVSTSGDFGVEGAEPTHPKLLDWLASELMSHGWSTKHIHRQILLSSTYRQQRLHSESNSAIDAENKLLWNWPLRRLEAEAIRDSVLVATGELDRSVGGVSVPPEREEQNLRRTIYLFQQRSSMPSVMAMFDAPEGIASCSRRSVSTVALQPLFMLNSQFMVNRANTLAKLISESASDVDQRIDFAFHRTLLRRPDTDELELARQMFGTNATQQSLSHLCHALFNLNEFVYIP